MFLLVAAAAAALRCGDEDAALPGVEAPGRQQATTTDEVIGIVALRARPERVCPAGTRATVVGGRRGGTAGLIGEEQIDC